MLNIEMGVFKSGASEFMSYWLPMILFTGDAAENQHIAYIMVFKYRRGDGSNVVNTLIFNQLIVA